MVGDWHWHCFLFRVAIGSIRALHWFWSWDFILLVDKAGGGKSRVRRR